MIINSRHAILDDHGEPVAATLMAYEEWDTEYNGMRRVVGSFYVPDPDASGEIVHVSTVFLGLNHGYDLGRPLWFETMVFGGSHDEFKCRYATRQEAQAGHLRIVEMVRTSIHATEQPAEGDAQP